MGGVMPVPAVCGGAIETLVTSIVKKYSRADGLDLTVCSVFHPEAVKVAKQYPEVRFFWTHTRSIKYLLMHAVFLGVRRITGKSIRPLQRHYNEIAQLFKKECFDLIIAEGGDTQAIADIAEGYRREQFVNHIHIHYLPPENIAENYGHVIGVSEFVTNEYVKACRIPVKAHTLKNAVDTSKFNKETACEERKALREELLLLLSKGDTQERVSLALIKQALDGNTKAFEVIRDTIGEKPVDKIEQEAMYTIKVDIVDE